MTGSQAEYLDHISVCADCGTDLVEQPGSFLDPSVLEAREAMMAAEVEDAATEDAAMQSRMSVMTGVFCIVIGVGGSLVTYALALPGGVYVVAWGPVVYGAIQLVRGMEQRASD